MKLSWFSPLPPAATDIGHFTKRLLPALVARADVTLWTDQTKWDSALERSAEVRSYDFKRMPWADLNRCDMCIYNIGNNPLFHGSIWQIARQHPGIVILHDTRLHQLFDGLYRVQRRDLSAYLAVMEFYYGTAGRNDGHECFMSEGHNINMMAEKYPLTDLATENALGVVVHTLPGFDALKREDSVPLTCLPLPFAAPARVAGRKDPPKERAEAWYRLILFGYIGRNRRLHSVLNALAAFPEREKFHLDIYGTIIDDEKQVRAQIRALGLKSLVTLHGFAAETELEEALARADLAINLRYPTMGEASGSQLRIWAHALPGLVTQVGWYATLPGEAVAHVRPGENEVADIQSHLRDFLNDPDRFARMGARGRAILQQQHSPENYADQLIEFVEVASTSSARVATCRLAEKAGQLTAELFGIVPESMLKSVTSEIGAMSGTTE